MLDDQSRILLVFRKRHPEANTWSIPGGKVELFELLEEAVVREIFEEVGVHIKVDRLLCTAETIDRDLGEHWISTIYMTSIVEGTPSNCEPDALSDLQWFDLDYLPDRMACFTRPVIEPLRRLYKNE